MLSDDAKETQEVLSRGLALPPFEFWLDDGWYIGRLREIPGVFSQGKTLIELESNLRDAYVLVLSN